MQHEFTMYDAILRCYPLSVNELKSHKNIQIYIYMGSGRFPGPMEMLLQQLVRVSKTR